jgi:type VI secretion system secreted protein VgrG
VAAGQLADSMETGPDAINPDNGKDGNKDSGHLQHHAAAVIAWEAGSNTDKDGKTAKDQAGQQPLLILPPRPASPASPNKARPQLRHQPQPHRPARRQPHHRRRWLHNVGQHISLFVAGVKDQIALKLIAAKGKVQVQAQSDAMESPRTRM